MVELETQIGIGLENEALILLRDAVEYVLADDPDPDIARDAGFAARFNDRLARFRGDSMGARKSGRSRNAGRCDHGLGSDGGLAHVGLGVLVVVPLNCPLLGNGTN